MSADKSVEKPSDKSLKITCIEGSHIQWFPIYDLNSATLPNTEMTQIVNTCIKIVSKRISKIECMCF